MKIYLAVPIIAHRQLENAKTIAQIIRNLGHELVSDWVINENPDFLLPAQKVFQRDLNGVKNCHVLVAEISHGSHGVGMEVMAAYLYGKPIIFVCEEKTTISHMIQGVPNAIFLNYNSYDDMAVKLRIAILGISSNL
jgi:nucleoside 2-deoxyribosyltransferase